MQDNLLALAGELGVRLKDSTEYREFAKALDAINQSPELRKRIFEYKSIQMEYGNRREIGIDEEKHLSKLYFDLYMIPEAKNFLQWEKIWLKLVMDIRGAVFSGTELNYL